MSVRRLIPLFLLLLANALPVQADNGWSTVAYPLAGSPEVIGSYAAGCIAGAIPLPLVGDGYQVMRPSRNRYYGHPLLIRLVERLGRQAADRGGRLLIGDLGQPLSLIHIWPAPGLVHRTGPVRRWAKTGWRPARQRPGAR